VLWENKNAAPINLGDFDGGLAWNTPTAINDRGQVVGFANQPGSPATAFNPIAFLWNQEHGIKAIAPIGDDTNSWAWGINDNGVVVGQSFGGVDDPTGRAFLYENGLATDLNTLIQPNSSLQLELANDINHAGEIVGFAQDTRTGTTVAFLAVPVDASNQVNAARSAQSNFGGRVAPESARRSLAGSFGRFVIDSLHHSR
jgi:probable HAF family extracellular repeat protein